MEDTKTTNQNGTIKARENAIPVGAPPAPTAALVRQSNLTEAQERAAVTIDGIASATPVLTQDEVKAMHVRAAQKALNQMYAQAAQDRGYIRKPVK